MEVATGYGWVSEVARPSESRPIWRLQPRTPPDSYLPAYLPMIAPRTMVIQYTGIVAERGVRHTSLSYVIKGQLHFSVHDLGHPNLTIIAEPILFDARGPDARGGENWAVADPLVACGSPLLTCLLLYVRVYSF